MNGPSPTMSRIAWTTPALNHCLEIQQSVRDMQISSDTRANTFVNGTTEDSEKIEEYIISKLGVFIRTTSVRKWRSNFWYLPNNGDETLPIVSDLLKIAFGKVGDLYLKHQNTWDEAEQVEEAESNSDEEDGVEQDPNNILW